MILFKISYIGKLVNCVYNTIYNLRFLKSEKITLEPYNICKMYENNSNGTDHFSLTQIFYFLNIYNLRSQIFIFRTMEICQIYSFSRS